MTLTRLVYAVLARTLGTTGLCSDCGKTVEWRCDDAGRLSAPHECS